MKDTYNFVKWEADYQGLILSLNDYNNSWQKLRTLKKKVEQHMTILILQHRPPRFEWFELEVRHNTSLDMDNVTGIIKPAVDTLRKHGVVDDDNKTNWDKMTIMLDKTLPKDTVRFVLVGEEKQC